MSAELEAVLTRLRNGPSGSLTVYDARPAASTYPYVVVYADEGVRDSDRESDVRIRRTVSWQTKVVGASAGQCRLARGRVNDALEDWIPTVDGRSCSKVEHENARITVTDDSLPDRIVFTGDDEWSVVSIPA